MENFDHRAPDILCLFLFFFSIQYFFTNPYRILGKNTDKEGMAQEGVPMLRHIHYQWFPLYAPRVSNGMALNNNCTKTHSQKE